MDATIGCGGGAAVGSSFGSIGVVWLGYRRFDMIDYGLMILLCRVIKYQQRRLNILLVSQNL